MGFSNSIEGGEAREKKHPPTNGVFDEYLLDLELKIWESFCNLLADSLSH